MNVNKISTIILVLLICNLVNQTYTQGSQKDVNLIQRQYKAFVADLKRVRSCFKQSPCDKDARQALGRLGAKSLALIVAISGVIAMGAGARVLFSNRQMKALRPLLNKIKQWSKTEVNLSDEGIILINRVRNINNFDNMHEIRQAVMDHNKKTKQENLKVNRIIFKSTDKNIKTTFDIEWDASTESFQPVPYSLL